MRSLIGLRERVTEEHREAMFAVALEAVVRVLAAQLRQLLLLRQALLFLLTPHLRQPLLFSSTGLFLFRS